MNKKEIKEMDTIEKFGLLFGYPKWSEDEVLDSKGERK